jgi:EAL domain-containing protein (putative c-di-GMP-specific phosphodiesterase class I)
VHEWFDTDITMRTRHGEMQWTTRIQHALDNDDFVLFAQRIQGLQSSDEGLRIEVLLRMKDTEGKLIQPGAFLPSAERYHLVSSIDRWVVSKTIAWMKTLNHLESIDHISINLSGQSVGDRAFHEWIYTELSSIDSMSIRPMLCFEITETAAVTNMGDAALFIAEVHKLGVRVALDDFGAGASSFGYLKNLTVDYLKIDGQFVRELENNPLHAAAVRCFVEVAKVVGMRTVAEFVESQLVRDHLQGLGVDFAQGYLVHKPEPLHNFFRRGSVQVQH